MGEDERTKIYVPDTNVLMANRFSPYILSGNEIPDVEEASRFQEALKHRGLSWNSNPNQVVLSDIVLRELDTVSHKADIRARMAKRAISTLEDMTLMFPPRPIIQGTTGEYGTNHALISLPNGADFLISEHGEAAFRQLHIPEPNVDDQLIYHTRQLQLHNPDKKVILVTGDKQMRAKARLLGVESQEFEFENIRDPNQLYPGLTYHPLPDNESIIVGKFLSLLPDAVEPVLGKAYKDKQPVNNQVLAFFDGTPDNIKHYYIVKPEIGRVNLVPVTGPHRLHEMIRGHNMSVKSHDLARLSRTDREHLIQDALAKAKEALSGRYSNRDRTMQTKRKMLAGFSDRAGNLNYENANSVIALYNQIQTSFGLTGNRASNVRYAARGSEDEDSQYSIDIALREDAVPIHEQIPYVQLLLDRKVDIMTVNGPAGCGKTYFALLAGLLGVLRGDYQSIKYVKPVVTSDEGLGFLPGNRDEKMDPLAQSAISNLKSMFGYNTAGVHHKEKIMRLIHNMQNDVIEYVSMTYEAGNSWPNQFIIVDETQLLTRELVKLSVGRLGEGSKLVFLGDLAQIATSRAKNFSYITESSSGLAHLIERFAGQQEYAHITLSEKSIRRSRGASLANLL